MNANREEPAGKKTLADALLAIDSRMPSSSAEGREIAKDVLRRDRRRVRILTWITIGFFLLTVIGICGSVFCYNAKIVYWMEHYRHTMLRELGPQISNQEPLGSFALLTGQACHVLSMGQLAIVGGIVALLVSMLAAGCCTVLLITASRRATLGQIQVSLLALSEQFDSLHQSLQKSHSIGDNQATQDQNG